MNVLHLGRGGKDIVREDIEDAMALGLRQTPVFHKR